MGNHNSGYRSERRQKAITELKVNVVGVLFQIVDELDAMKLSVREIDVILRHCGLNYRNALQMGEEMRAERCESTDKAPKASKDGN